MRKVEKESEIERDKERRREGVMAMSGRDGK